MLDYDLEDVDDAYPAHPSKGIPLDDGYWTLDGEH